MKVIDLINMINNGEDVPSKIKFENAIYEYDEERKDYIYEIDDWCSETLMFKVMNCHFIKEILETKVELIEDNTIDIYSIEELGQYCNIIEHTENEKVLFRMMQNNANKIDETIQAVKQLKKEIKELKER